VAKREDLDAFL